jgi:nucleotide-binding universal stress UspA family protein
MEINKILFTTDFSEGTSHALAYATDLSRKYGAKLHILHVVHNVFIYPGLHIPHGSFDIANKEMEEAAQKALRKVTATACVECKEMESSVIVGIPYEEIIKYSLEHAIDLIVIGSHGRKGLNRAILGSTAESVVRNAHCPVLTVRMPI